jgi:hypothetical protein
MGASVLQLRAPLQRLLCRISPDIEQYKIVHVRLPKESRSGEIRGDVDFDSMTPQDASAYLARNLAAVNQKNSPVTAVRRTTV